MALRAFRSNPGLGGFGGESSSVAIDEQDCDAFAQIVKELVDNAVDACSASSSRSSSTEAKRVRVTIERVNEDKTSDDDDSYLLEVTVTDNGSGMLSIQDCVEAFRTSKAQGKDEEEAAVVLGARGWQTFWHVTLPNIKWGLLYGVILCNARAMGEFGAVSVVSGHIRGETNTLPLHVEILYNEYQFSAAFAVASILAFLALITLGIKTWVEHQAAKQGVH